MKSRKRRSAVEGLRVATPQTTQLEWLSRIGLIAPDEIASDEDFIPLDFTRLNSRELGFVHSRFAVRHSHAIFQLAKIASEVASFEHDLKITEGKFRARNGRKYPTKWKLDDAMLNDEEITDMREQLVIREQKYHIIEGIAKGYDGLSRAASREISRRISEQAPRD